MFKTVIKVKLLNPACKIEINPKGDWIDLRSSTTRVCPKGKFVVIPLGVCVKLPAGFEAVIASRSSTYPRNFVYNPSSIGIIDNAYCGDDDEWKWLLYSCKDFDLHEGMRICQFRVRLSQHATWWQKLKWIFSSGVEIQYVDKLGGESRGGFGTTGVK